MQVTLLWLLQLHYMVDGFAIDLLTLDSVLNKDKNYWDDI
jgi:hypothetical protein